MTQQESAQKALEYYTQWNAEDVKFIVDTSKNTYCTHGYIFFPMTDPPEALNKLAGSGVILVTHDGEVHPLWYFGNIEKAIEVWEKEKLVGGCW